MITAMTMSGNAFSNALTGLSSGSGFLSNGLNLEVQTTAETLLRHIFLKINMKYLS